jgi:murein DD-endopeptidase MepM/ murein hydrolase activator NlpD
MPRAVPVISVNAPATDGPVVFPAILPARGYITRGFGSEANHYGLDIAAKTGSIVSAAADGTVLFAGWTPDDGYLMVLVHAGGFVTIYKHNQSLLRPANARVRRGDPIALLGDSGRTSLGPHLHFEIWKDGSPVDPSLYVMNLAI